MFKADNKKNEFTRVAKNCLINENLLSNCLILQCLLLNFILFYYNWFIIHII